MTSSSFTSGVRVPFLDLQAAYAELKTEIDDAIARVLSRSWFILGEEGKAFEEEFARYCGTAHCVGVSNGLDALQLALRAWNIGPGDEVIVPAHTFIATWLAVSHCGATVVPVDVDARTFNVDPELVESAITPRTRAIIPVHLYGQPADIDPIMSLAERNRLLVLEDAAQAQGSSYKRRRAGALGHAAAWSFYPGKNLGAFGDAGAVTSNDGVFIDRVRELANYGSRIKYVHAAKGANCRLDELQAAVLRAKLPALDRWNARRAEIAGRYRRALAGTVGMQHEPAWASSAWHLFVVRTPRRDEIQAALTSAGVHTQIHYPLPPFEQQAYQEMQGRRAEWPVAKVIASELLSLPIGPHMPDEHVDAVVQVIRNA